MPISNSPKLGYPIPGAVVNDSRLVDIQAVKSALLSIDTTLSNVVDDKSLLHGSIESDFSIKTVTVAGNIIPTTSSTQDIGSPTNRFKSIYVDEAYLSVNTLYLGDTPVLGTNQDVINITADLDQSILVKTTGLGSSLMTSSKNVTIASTGSNSDIVIESNATGGIIRINANQSIEITSPVTNVYGNINNVGNQTISGGLTITGDLTVNGTNTVVNTTTVTTKDNIIEINKGQVGSGVSATYAGLKIDRGDDSSYQMVFDETDDMFKVGMAGQLQTIASQQYVISVAAPLVHGHAVATTSLSGFLSASDKTAIDNIATTVSNAVSVETTNRTNADNAEVTARNLAITNSATTLIASIGSAADAAALDATTKANAAQAAAISSSTPIAHVGSTGASHGIATLTVNGFMSNNDKTKLDGIDIGAQVNAVTSVAGRDGDVVVTKTDVGLGNVDNTADSVKNVATAVNVEFTGITNKPTTVSGFGITDVYNKTETDSRIQAVVGAAPAALDTLVEIATQLGNDQSAVSALTTVVSGKAATSYVDAQLLTKSNTDHAHAVVSVTVDGIMSAADKVKLDAITGTNSGDETLSTIKTKLGVTTLSGSNTGDQIIPTTLPASDVYAWAKAATKPTYTSTEVGLGNVNNTTDANKPVSTAQAAADAAVLAASAPIAHVGSSGGAHAVATLTVNGFMSNNDKTKLDGIANGATANVGTVTAVTGSGVISSTGGTTPAISISLANGSTSGYLSTTDWNTFNGKQNVLGYTPINSNLLGVVNGVATLDSNGLVPSTQLPSYVDDVLEYANLTTFPATGVTGKIYVALDTNKTYRWSGTVYVYITSGAVDSVAGKTGIISLVKADVGLSNVDNTADSAKPVSTAQSLAIGLKLDATHAGTGGTAHANVIAAGTAGFMTGADKAKLDGIATSANNYSLPIAAAGVLGGVKVGSGLAIDGAGVLSAAGATNIAQGTNTTTTVLVTSSTGTGATLTAATTSLAGVMTSVDKTKLDAITGSNTGDQTLTSLGIPNVENKSSATIRSELTSGNVTTALGFTPASAGLLLTMISTNTTAVAAGNYVFTASCTLTLPAAPTANDAICFSNRSGVLTCKIGANGNKIMGVVSDLTLDSLVNAYGRLVYANATLGWIFI